MSAVVSLHSCLRKLSKRHAWLPALHSQALPTHSLHQRLQLHVCTAHGYSSVSTEARPLYLPGTAALSAHLAATTLMLCVTHSRGHKHLHKHKTESRRIKRKKGRGERTQAAGRRQTCCGRGGHRGRQRAPCAASHAAGPLKPPAGTLLPGRPPRHAAGPRALSSQSACVHADLLRCRDTAALRWLTGRPLPETWRS